MVHGKCKGKDVNAKKIRDAMTWLKNSTEIIKIIVEMSRVTGDTMEYRYESFFLDGLEPHFVNIAKEDNKL